MRISKENDLVTSTKVFDTTPGQREAPIDQWVRFTEQVTNEPYYVRTAWHKSTGGARVINCAYRRFKSDFDAFLERHGADFPKFLENASRIDPHTYEVVYLDEPATR